jgi:hypothetical protein
MNSLFTTLTILVVAILLVVFVLSRVGTQKQLTTTFVVHSSSSYEQKTNHFPRPSYDAGPIQGSESPYQVNQWMSYQV